MKKCYRREMTTKPESVRAGLNQTQLNEKDYNVFIHFFLSLQEARLDYQITLIVCDRCLVHVLFTLIDWEEYCCLL